MMYLKFLLMWDVFHEYEFPRIYDFFLENRPLLDTIITLLPSTLICTEFAYVSVLFVVTFMYGIIS